MTALARHAEPASMEPAQAHRFAFLVLLAYFFIEYVRPQDRIGGLKALQLGLLASLLSFALWLAKANKSALRDPLTKTAWAFVALCATSIFYSVNTFWAFQNTRTVLLEMLAAVLPSAALLALPGNMLRFFRAWVAFHVIVAVTSIGANGRGPGGFLGDENDLALALNMAVPYAYFLAGASGIKPRTRTFLRISLLALMVGAIFTWSRGGFLGLLAAFIMIWLLSKNKLKNLVLILVIGVGVLGGFSLFSEKGSVIAEFNTISDPSDNTRRDRMNSWRAGWIMYADNPFFGVGAGNYPWRVGEYQLRDPSFDPAYGASRAGRAAHSLYFTLLPELGTLGVLLFLAMVVLIFSKCRAALITQATHEESRVELEVLQLVAKAMVCSLVSYLVGGAFISVLWYPHLFYLSGFAIGLSLALRRLEMRRASSTSSGGHTDVHRGAAHSIYRP